MLLSSYDPRGKGSCPFCKKLQSVYLLGGDLYYSMSLTLRCETCKGEWRYWLNRDVSIEILKAPPMSEPKGGE